MTRGKTILGIDPGLATIGYGVIKAVDDDYEIIDVLLSTPRIKPTYRAQFLLLLERFPMLYRIFYLIREGK